MKIIGIDPGIAAVAVALFDSDRLPQDRDPRDFSGHMTAIHALARVETLRTDAADPESVRAAEIFEFILEALGEAEADRVVIEIPRTWHRSTMKRQGAKRVLDARAKMNRGLGAVLAAVGLYASTAGHAVEVNEQPAHKGRKDERRNVVDRLLESAGSDPSSNEHEADAIFYGLTEAIEALDLDLRKGNA